MRKKERFFFIFFSLLFLAIIIVALSLGGLLKVPSSILDKLAAPIGIKVYSIFQNLPFVSESEEETKLKDKNLDLLVDFSEIQKLKEENAALKDQFQTTKPKSYDLLPAKIVGHAFGFVVDKGERDAIKEGQTVVFKNNLVGIIGKVSSHLSKVELVFDSSSSFTAKTMIKGVSGIVKGDGRKITIDNVLASDKIEVGEIVVTKGDMNLEGIGYPPDLIVGKITSIDKNPSSLFQKARLQSFVDFNNLDMVFILKI